MATKTPAPIKKTLESEFARDFKQTITREPLELSKAAFAQFLGLEGSSATSEGDAQPETPETPQDPTGAIEIFNAARLTPHDLAERRVGAKKLKEAGGNKSNAEAAIHYDIKNNGEKTIKSEHQTDSQKMQELQAELRQHTAKADHSKKMSLSQHTIQDASRHANKQRITFFEGLIRGLRDGDKTSDASFGQGLIKGKNAKKGDFSIANGKMHQSGERSTIQNSAG